MSGFFTGVTAEQLADVPLFEGFEPAALDTIRQSSHFIGAHPGLHIIRKDDAGFDLYVILSGSAEVVRDGDVVAELGKGDVFGELAVLGNIHRNADVVARTVMSLLTLTTGEFRRVVAAYPELERRVRQIAEARLR